MRATDYQSSIVDFLITRAYQRGIHIFSVKRYDAENMSQFHSKFRLLAYNLLNCQILLNKSSH